MKKFNENIARKTYVEKIPRVHNINSGEKAKNELILAERDSALAENESLRRQLQELQAQKNWRV